MASYIRPVVFSVNGQLFGVDIELVLSIEKELEVVSVPGSTENVCGIINLRGNVIPAYDLRKKFGMSQVAEKQDKSIIVVNTKDTTLAFEVDEVHQIGDVDPANICEMPILAKGLDASYLDRVANIDGKLVILLDVDALLSENELSGITTAKQLMNEKAKEKSA